MPTNQSVSWLKDDQNSPEVQDFMDTMEQILGEPAGAEPVNEDSQEANTALVEKKSLEYSQYVYEIAGKLLGQFSEVEGRRRPIEERWLEDLRQYKGEYSPEVLANIDVNRSSAFVRITYNKVKTIDSRLSDLLFPSADDKNWGIRPTPIPELSPKDKETIEYQITEQLGHVPSDTEFNEVMVQLAKKRCEEMQKEIEDQLASLRYRDIVRNVIHSGNLYGTGILKGPLVKDKVTSRWEKDANGTWTTTQTSTTTPYAEFVPAWDVYPDMSVTDIDDVRFIYQRHLMGKDKLYELSTRSDFYEDAIKSYIKARPNGNATYRAFESEIYAMRDANTMDTSRGNRYEVLEYWGYVNVEDIKDIPKFDLPKDYDLEEVAVNIWLLDNVVIKAVVSPIESCKFPYFFYYFAKDETNIFGEGIASILREPQLLANAAIRVMMDNAAIAAGPIIEANLDLLPSNEDPTDLHPFRVILRTGQGQEASYPALRVNSLPSYTDEFMKMFDLFLKIGDDVSTIPRYMYGDPSSSAGGAGRTASGLSMMMGAANITLKEQVKNIDEGVTKPFISAMYAWNMEFSPREEIKGDYEIVALGTTSLIAKEVRAESLLRFVQLTSNPEDIRYTNRPQIIREIAKIMDLDGDSLVKNDQQLALEQQQETQAQAFLASQRQQEAQTNALMSAIAGGHAQPGAASGNTPQ